MVWFIFVVVKQVVEAPQGQNAALIREASDKLEAVQVPFKLPLSLSLFCFLSHSLSHSKSIFLLECFGGTTECPGED
jgi:hypothetical protein